MLSAHVFEQWTHCDLYFSQVTLTFCSPLFIHEAACAMPKGTTATVRWPGGMAHAALHRRLVKLDMKKDVSILIVHYNTPGLLRQTLKGLYGSNPKVSFEVIVVDNNPNVRVRDWVQKEFPLTKVVMSDHNIGFGRGMNLAMQHANARYYFVFNPDIATFEGTLEALVAYMDEHPDIGMLGPKLLNPDRTLQYSCYRFMKPFLILYRRIPILRSMSFAKRAVDDYQMKDWTHDEVADVDYLLGAAIFVRKEAVDQVGGFDPAFFVYFEDQDWCRRFWKAGWRVVYHPSISLIHYHRRETAEGSFFQQIRNPLTRIQMQSAIYYYRKYRGEENPREHVARRTVSASDRANQSS